MKQFHIGFSGSRVVTVGQVDTLRDYMTRYGLQMQEEMVDVVLHHGDCVGGDEAAHVTASEAPGWKIEVHPGTDGEGESPHRAYMATAMPDRVQEVHEPCAYMERNMDIVTTTAFLLAAPSGPEKKRSGTWSTVRAARRLRHPVIIFWPDGDATMEGFEDHEHVTGAEE